MIEELKILYPGPLNLKSVLSAAIAISIGLRGKGYMNGIYANQNYPGDMQQPLRSNLERIEKSVHEVFDLEEIFHGCNK